MPNRQETESEDDGNYVVEKGDCLSSIAFAHRLFFGTVWNHPKNSELRSKRKNPNILRLGDNVYIPELRIGEVSCATGKRHKFKLKGVPIRIRIQVKDFEDKARANERYKLLVDGKSYSGKLDGNGFLNVAVAPGARQALLTIADEDEFDLLIGGVDPISEISGVQHRLNNLGYYCGEVDGILGRHTMAAIRAFQQDQQIKVTGEPDDLTRERLTKAHIS